MLKFVLGIVVGALLSIAYVHFGLAPPKVVELPSRLAGNVVSTATESVLYDLDADAAARRRALEVYFANRAPDAAAADAEAGHPLLTALHRERARREARQLLQTPAAFDEALAKPALREALERKHGTTDTGTLKKAMLMEALERKPFLKAWLARNGAPLTDATLGDALKATAAYAPATQR
ncbi:MAG: hypothetical protein AB7E80_09050 [Hyphomicrobiaceae bacterium]